LAVNVPLPTLGGAQLWADETFWHGWHIQRNVITGHYRLLDPRSVRRAWGSLEHCRQRLDAIAGRAESKPMSGAAVIVMHGLLRSARGMRGLARYLESEGGYTAFNVNYPSTRLPIAEHAAALDRILRGLEGIDEIHLVCHSLGNLVVRHYLADAARGVYDASHGDREGTRGLHDGARGVHAGEPGPDPRLKRMVMLGPPNQGAGIATWLARVDPLKLVGAAHEIHDWRSLEPRLAVPHFDFGVIAGGRGARRGYNPLLPGDNDMIVTVESTRLAGARDFVCLPVLHTLMMDDRRVRDMTLNFLRHGYFLSADNRQAIPDAC
jgi:pimeloyl-ACP methyl ester carboxylesterase